MVFDGAVASSPGFAYPDSSVCKNSSNPTPTISGTPGGEFTAVAVFPASAVLVFTDGSPSSTGTVDLAASDPGAYQITYTVAGVSETDAFSILAVQVSTFSYSSSSFQQIGTESPTFAVGTTTGGTFAATSGIIFQDTGTNTGSSTGVINLGLSTIGGPYTITYTSPGPCASASTFDISVTAVAVALIDNNFAMAFNGTDQYVDVKAFDNTLLSDGDISFSLWCKLTTTGTFQYILSSTHTGSVSGINIAMSNNTNLLFERSQDIANTQNSTGYTVPGFSYGSWHHLCGAYSAASGELKAYVNGVLKSTTTDIADPRTASAPLKIGGLSTYATLHASKGDIDEVAIWSKTLQLGDVQRIYNATNDNPGKCANLFTAGLGTGLVFWNRMGD